MEAAGLTHLLTEQVKTSPLGSSAVIMVTHKCSPCHKKQVFIPEAFCCENFLHHHKNLISFCQLSWALVVGPILAVHYK